MCRKRLHRFRGCLLNLHWENQDLWLDRRSKEFGPLSKKVVWILGQTCTCICNVTSSSQNMVLKIWNNIWGVQNQKSTVHYFYISRSCRNIWTCFMWPGSFNMEHNLNSTRLSIFYPRPRPGHRLNSTFYFLYSRKSKAFFYLHCFQFC